MRLSAPAVERHERHEKELGLFQELGDEIVDVGLRFGRDDLQPPQADSYHGSDQNDHHHDHACRDEPILGCIVR